MSDADQDRVDELERVLLRLGLTDDTKLCDVLRLLLPQLFNRLISTASTAISQKILDIFGHLVKRLKSLPVVQVNLPTLALLPFLDVSSTLDMPETQALHHTYARNFSLLFVEMGFTGTLAKEDRAVVLSTIVRGVADKSSAYMDVVCRVFLHAFLWQDSTTLPDAQWTDRDLRVLLDFFLDVLLFPSDALTTTRKDRLVRAKVNTLEKSTRTDVQLRIVQFLKNHAAPGTMDVSLWYVHMAVGAAADFHAISTYCQEELSRLHKYNLDALDTPSSLAQLYHLMLGSKDDANSVLLVDRHPLPDLVSLVMMPLLLQAKSAANSFPMNLQVICTFLFGDSPSRPRVVKANIRKAGMDLCKWVLAQAHDAILGAALGPVLFSPLMKLLVTGSDDAVDVTLDHELKTGVYACFATLAQRVPTLVGGSAETFQRLLYRAMVEEEKRGGSSCLEALRAVSVAYVGSHVPSGVTETIKRELMELSTSSKVQQPKYDRVRGVLAHWASQMQFQGSDTNEAGGDLDMRLVCLRFAGDANESVRAIAVKTMFLEPLPSFRATMRVVHPELSTLQATSLDHALTLCLKSLKADAPHALQASDIQLLVDACVLMLDHPKKEFAAETLVQLSQLGLGVLDGHADRIRHTMLEDSDERIREQMAILLASMTLDKVEWIQELRAILETVDTTPTQRHGALGGIGMLLRNHAAAEKQLLGDVLVRETKTHLGKVQESTLSNHDYKFHSQMLFSSVQALGAIGNLVDLGASGDDAMQVVLDVLALTPSPSDSTDMTKVLRTRSVQTLGALVYGLPLDPRASVDQCIDKLIKLAETKDAPLQFCIADVFVALGYIAAESSTAPTNRVGDLVQRLLKDGIGSTNPHVRNSASIWLFGIITCMTATPPSQALKNEWSTQLPPLTVHLHEVLIDLLNEQNALTQECAVKALAMLFEHAGSEFADELSNSLFKRLKCFRAFLDPSTPATPSAGDAPANGTTPPAVPEATNTIENACYREVSNVAAEVGDASVMYTLLYLSTNDPMWGLLVDPTSSATSISKVIRLPFDVMENDRAFGATQTQKAHRQWHTSSIAILLVPRLFLLKAHPNPKIGNCMLQLWKIMVGDDEKAVAGKYWEQILAYALHRLEHSRNFKYREAACVALVDLLNGKEAKDVRNHLSQLWKMTARAVDDVNEMVVVAGIKLVKCVGELSLRVAAVDVLCLDQVLPFLVHDGIVSSNKLCQALCMGYLLRLIKSIPPHHLKAYLSTLPVTLLECMSSLEMPELQYAQFHVQDKRQLEKLRVSLSQAGPVGELLHACLSQLSQLSADQGCTEIVRELCDGVCSVLRSGVGLNTRVGAANFVASLVTDVPLEMRQSGGAEKLLTKIFVPYITQAVLNETHDFYESEEVTQEDGLRDGLVVRAYCRAAAYVAKLVAATGVAQYVRGALVVPTTIVFASTSTTEKGFGRYGWVTVTALQELLQQLPPTIQNHEQDWCVQVFSVAFVGQFSSQALLSAAWKVVLEHIPPTLYYSSQYVESTLSYACDLLSHLSWESRKQGASAIMALSHGEYLKWIHEWSTTVRKIKAAIPGRLWRGKGILLEALGCTYDLANEPEDIVSVLVDECDRALRNAEIAYLESAVVSLGSLAKAPSLASFEILRKFFFETTTMTECPPLIYKRMFETLGKWWPSMQATDDAGPGADVLAWICDEALTTYHVWSVREAIFGCLEQIVARVSYKSLANRKTMDSLVAAAQSGASDPKFAAVRKAALHVLVALSSRREPNEAPLVSFVVHKEELVDVATKLTHDSEPTVCLAAAKLLEGLQAMH
ncbi:Aste57867_24483 [Aphanomyces stellatus]|uniref:Aste57867_24483 protein n=1 Tax=Aphanomyces stellatus TaxID=120398 RepID=A0A485LQG6_9STRA|nr:hypothetical protein As57867_024406 [Aphanomyces stellatus]VFU01122.1 Aste57867_24483 [Aphanomyces stellatus]